MKTKIIFVGALLSMITTNLFAANGDGESHIDFVSAIDVGQFLLLYLVIFCAIIILCCLFAEKMSQIIWIRRVFAGLFIIFASIGVTTESFIEVMVTIGPILISGFIITLLFTKRVRKKELMKQGFDVENPLKRYENGYMRLKGNGREIMVDKKFRMDAIL